MHKRFTHSKNLKLFLKSIHSTFSSIMFSKLCICNHDSTVNSLEQSRMEKKPQISSSRESLKQKLRELQQKETVLKSRISQEIDRAKGSIKSQDKRAAMECLKRKKYYEGQLEQLGRFQLLVRSHEQELSKLLPSMQRVSDT